MKRVIAVKRPPRRFNCARIVCQVCDGTSIKRFVFFIVGLKHAHLYKTGLFLLSTYRTDIKSAGYSRSVDGERIQ